MRFETSLLFGLLLVASVPAQASDISEALHFVDGAIGEEAISNYDELERGHDNAALGMLTARDIEVGRDLEDYGCDESMIDGEYTLRTSGQQGWAGRACRELRFRRDHVKGFATMGPRPLFKREIAPMLERAEAATGVPAALLEAIIRFQSGRRPGLVSEDGRYGLMQLRPDLLRGQGIDPSNLLDPETNVRKGAEYVRRLTLQFKGLKMGLAAYLEGPGPVARAGDIPDDKATLFFVRETTRLYYASIRSVPTEIAAESMAFVWNWLE